MEDSAGDRNTVIGNGASFKGEINSDGTLHIDGKFEGKINSRGRLFIGSTAEIQAEVSAVQVLVEGEFKGVLTAQDRVEIAATAKVQGEIRSLKLVVAEGATLVGNVQVNPAEQPGTSGAAAGRPAVAPAHAAMRR
jgi:cytoskeletal protein CcmA (bactofilin family)